MYLLTGFEKAVPACRYFLAIASLASVPSEAAAAELLKDDRFLKRADEIWQLMEENMLYLSDLSDYVLQRYAALAQSESDGGGDDLRQDVLLGGHISIGYLYHDQYVQLQHLPLSLTQGDIAGRIAHLISSGPSADTIGRPVQNSNALGVSAELLTDFFTLV